jgi:ABC-type multidrug transport system ATPase subunit
MADRIGFMRKGRLVMLKTAAELAHEDLTDLYIQYMEEQPAPAAAAPAGM